MIEIPFVLRAEEKAQSAIAAAPKLNSPLQNYLYSLFRENSIIVLPIIIYLSFSVTNRIK